VTGSSPAGYTHRLAISSAYGINATRADLSDLRFHEGSCASPGLELSYFIDSGVSDPDHIVWVRTATADVREIAMYYGNGSAMARSDAAGTFDLFDEFEGSALDSTSWTTELWKTNCTKNSTTVAGGKLTLEVASSAAGDKGCDMFVTSTKQFSCGSPGTLVEFRGIAHPYWRGGIQANGIYRRADEGLGEGPGGTSGDSVAIVADEYGVYLSRCLSGACSPPTVAAIDVSQPSDLGVACVAGEVTWFANGDSPSTLTGGSPASLLRVFLHVATWDEYIEGSRTEVSGVRARRYVQPEPALAIGAEQGADAGCR
jgi:hypothetical protein